MEPPARETVPIPYDPEILEAMSCDIGARPPRAPHFDDVAGALRVVRREPGAIVVEYDPEASAALEAVVAAERLCCTDIGWRLERPAPAEAAGATPDAVVRLRIEASPAQLEVVGLLFRPAAGTTSLPPFDGS
jgi:hypothetical protein